MIITIDASAAIELVMGRPDNEFVASVLRSADWVVAPSLFIYETSNVMWKYHKFQGVPVSELLARVEQAHDIVDEYLPAKELYKEALKLACRIQHPVYDAIYLVTSRRRKSKLLTLDSRLKTIARELAVPICSQSESSG